MFRGYQQHDAQEFVRYLFSHLNEVTEKNREVDEDQGRVGLIDGIFGGKVSLILEVQHLAGPIRFYGSCLWGIQLVYTTQCRHCSRCTERQEGFLDISLPVGSILFAFKLVFWCRERDHGDPLGLNLHRFLLSGIREAQFAGLVPLRGLCDATHGGVFLSLFFFSVFLDTWSCSVRDHWRLTTHIPFSLLRLRV
jgi:hypothetical protein